MKEKLGWICCLLLVTVFGYFYFSQNSQAKTKDIWEYHLMSKANFELLNRNKIDSLGQEGWEIAVFLPADQNNLATIVLKRKKQ